MKNLKRTNQTSAPKTINIQIKSENFGTLKARWEDIKSQAIFVDENLSNDEIFFEVKKFARLISPKFFEVRYTIEDSCQGHYMTQWENAPNREVKPIQPKNAKNDENENLKKLQILRNLFWSISSDLQFANSEKNNLQDHVSNLFMTIGYLINKTIDDYYTSDLFVNETIIRLSLMGVLSRDLGLIFGMSQDQIFENLFATIDKVSNKKLETH